MTDGFLDLSDFEEELVLKESIEWIGLLPDIQSRWGVFLGMRSFRAANADSSLLAVDQLSIRFRKIEGGRDEFMEEERQRLAMFGSPIEELALTPYLDTKDILVLSAGEFQVQSPTEFLFNALTTIQERLFVLRVAITYKLHTKETPLRELQSILTQVVHRSRMAREFPYH